MQVSHYAQYIRERTHDHIYEDNFGFITWRYLPTGEVYIIDLFVPKEFRRDGHAKRFADKVVKEAKEKGSTKLIGTVVPSMKNTTISTLALIGYGMKLEQSGQDLVVYGKEI